MAGLLKRARNSFVAGSLLAALVTAVVFVLASHSTALTWLEDRTYDARVRLLDRHFADDEASRRQAAQYVVIDIDNATFDEFKPMFGRWPWSRKVWSTVLQWVDRGGPKVIGVDIIFGGKEDTPGVDEQFARVIRDSGHMVLAYSFNPSEHENTGDQAFTEKAGLLAPHSAPAPANAIGDRIDPAQFELNVPLPMYAEGAAGLGAINSIPDGDGTLRRVQLQFLMPDAARGKSELRAYPSFVLRMAQVSQRTSPAPLARSGRYAANASMRVPVDAEGRMVVLWRNRALESSRVPLWQVICSMYPTQCPPEVKHLAPDFFHDKIVLLGSSASASYDAHTLPLGGKQQAPGFIVHMNAVADLLRGEAVQVAPGWVTPLAIFFMAFAGSAVLLLASSVAASSAFAIAIAGAYSTGVYALFRGEHLWFPIAAPVAAFATSFVATALVRYATTGRELRRTRGTLDRYISPQLVQYVLEHIDHINLAGEKRELTILFSDVRNFTTMTEGSDPMELIRTLNEYLAEMTDVIFKYDGITDKFIGDGILAYWGAFTPGKNHAELACRAALEMLERLRALNVRWRAEGRQELAIGIGINTGEVVFGNVGSGRKIEFTVIGDAVNLAARLESQTKDFGVKVMISEFTRSRLDGLAEVRSLGGVKVKGKTVETSIFELQSMPPSAPRAASTRT